MERQIIFSEHAKSRMLSRGAEEQEIIFAIQTGKWQSIKMGKFNVRQQLFFGKHSPINQKFDKNKIIDVVFAEEKDKIIVITVKIYYHN